MKTRSVAVLLFLFASALPALVRAEEPAVEPLDAFPQKTGVVLRLASIDKISAGFNELTAALGPVAAQAGPQFKAGLGEMFQVGPQAEALEAIDQTAPAYAAVFPLVDQREPVAYLVRTADEETLRRAVLRAGPDAPLTVEMRPDGFVKITSGDRTYYFGRHGDGVLYTPNEAVVQLLAFDRTQQPTLASLVEPRAAELLSEGDGAVFVNAALLIETFADQIKQGREQVHRLIQSLPDDQLRSSGQDPEAIRKIYRDLADLVFDSISDARWAAGRANFSAAGANLAGVLGVKEASATDQFLAASPPAEFEMLGLLPAGAGAYFGFSWNYERLGEWLAEYLKLAYPQGTESAETIQAALAQMGQSSPGPLVASFDMPSAPGAGMVSIVLQQAEDPQKLIAGNRAYQASIGSVNTPVFKQTSEYQEAAESYQEHPVDLLVQHIEFVPSDDQGLAIAQKFIEKFFGGNALQTRITALEGLFAQTTANDPKHLHQLIDGLESAEGVLGLEESFSQVRDNLAENANLIVLLNVPKLIVDSVRMVREIPPFDAALAAVPFNFGFQPPPSYAGLSLGTEPQGLRVHIFVPVDQPKGVMQIFGQGR